MEHLINACVDTSQLKLTDHDDIATSYPKPTIKPHKLHYAPDIVLNAIHYEYGWLAP